MSTVKDDKTLVIIVALARTIYRFIYNSLNTLYVYTLICDCYGMQYH